MDLCVVGLGRLGGCLAASLACAGHQVEGIDCDPAALDAMLRPHHEPYLDEMLDEAGSRLALDTRWDAVEHADMVFVVVPTPSTESGDFDFSAVEAVCRRAAEVQPAAIVVVCSTVSPGTMGYLAHTYPTAKLVYSPMFIALGSIIEDMAHPDFRLIGGDTATAEAVASVLAGLGEAPSRIMTAAEAEVTKLAVNAFLTTKAAYGDTIAMACQRAGVDAHRVLEAVGSDRRIGKTFVTPGAVPGGPCLPRDARALGTWLCQQAVTDVLPRAVEAVRHLHVTTVAHFFDRYRTVAVLGLAYKPGTPVTEASLGRTVADLLEKKGKAVICHDPYMSGPNPFEVIADADAVLVATAHPEYRQLDTQGKPTLDMWGCTAGGPNVTVWGKGQASQRDD